jgi:hypothetical protein
MTQPDPTVALAAEGNPDPCDDPGPDHAHYCEQCGASLLFSRLECAGIVTPTCMAIRNAGDDGPLNLCGGTKWGVSVTGGRTMLLR